MLFPSAEALGDFRSSAERTQNLRLRANMKSNRIFNLMAALLFLVLSAFASSAQAQTTPQQRELADYIKSHYLKREVMIPMRDGVKLFTQIYEPKDAKQKYPMMFDRTCYSVAPYGQDKF